LPATPDARRYAALHSATTTGAAGRGPGATEWWCGVPIRHGSRSHETRGPPGVLLGTQRG
jgi:hypothetical protein